MKSIMKSVGERVRWTSSLRQRLVLLGAIATVAVTAVIVFSPAEPAEALPNKMVMEFYYSDPDFQNQVGWRTVLRCAGTSGPLNGSLGQYTQVEEITCRDWSTRLDCYEVHWQQCSASNKTVQNCSTVAYGMLCN